MGCDVRLLRFIKDLVYLNQEVSMLFRGSTPQHMRQPKSKQLASILHIDDFEEDQLRKGLRPPPGLYEWTTAERFAQLIALGHFNIVIVFLWFWYDPQPSAAELMLPLVRAHAPKDRQPFVALLSDDAHAIRASRLGEVEIHVSTREGYNDRARNYWIREKNLYRLADMAMHISGMDQVGGCATPPPPPPSPPPPHPPPPPPPPRPLPPPPTDRREGSVSVHPLLQPHADADPRVPDPQQEQPDRRAGPLLPAHRQHRLHRQRADADQPPRDPVVSRALLARRPATVAGGAYAADRAAAGGAHGKGRASAVREERGPPLRMGVGHRVLGRRGGERNRRARLLVGGGATRRGALVATDDRPRAADDGGEHEDLGGPRARHSARDHAAGRLAVRPSGE